MGAQEFSLPALLSPDAVRVAGIPTEPRNLAGPGACAGEVFTTIARKEIRSYKDLPQIWYRIGGESRGESPSGSGLSRLQQFVTADSCSFDVDREGLEKSYGAHDDAFRHILDRCAIGYVSIAAGPGTGVGDTGQRFMARTDAGKDFVLACSCGYASNLETADSRLPDIEDTPGPEEPRPVHTPGRKTIAEIADFLGVPPAHQIKSLVYVVDDKPHLLLVRGDHQLSETKLMAAVDSVRVRPAGPDEIRAAFGAEAGSLGPVGVESMPVLADLELKGRANLTCGANRDDYHLQGVAPGTHFQPVWADLRTAGPGEACVRCGKPLEAWRAAELGRLLRPGTEYSAGPGATVLTPEGKQTPLVTGSYSIDLELIMLATVECHHDNDGIVWPPSVAPFSVIVTPVNYREETRAAADELYSTLARAGVDVLLDDRQERPGVKFKDADLIGIPYRIVLGAEKLKQGKAELFERATKRVELLDLASVVQSLSEKLTFGSHRP